MKFLQVVAILTLVISSSLAARISDRDSRASKQERPRDKPSGSFNIQLEGGHITRVDFGGSRDSKKIEPHRAQARSDGHRFFSAGSQRQPPITQQSSSSRTSFRHAQPTTKRPFITHKPLNTGGTSRLQKRNHAHGSAFNINRSNTKSQRVNSGSSSSIPSHFTIQQRTTEKPPNHFTRPVTHRPVTHRPVPRNKPRNHFSPPVTHRPVQRNEPHSHFNPPGANRQVQRKEPHNPFNPPVVDRPSQLDRPAHGHFSPATFHFTTPAPSKSSRIRPKSSPRIPESSHRASSKSSTRRPASSHRTQSTPRPSTRIRNKSASGSQTSINFNSRRTKPAGISSHSVPKGVNPSKFQAPKPAIDEIDDLGPTGNNLQAIVLSPNLPASAKDIPTIFYPVKPNIGPSNRIKA